MFSFRGPMIPLFTGWDRFPIAMDDVNPHTPETRVVRVTPSFVERLP